MKDFRPLVVAGTIALLASAQTSAAVIHVEEYAFNVDGVINSASGINLGGFNTSTGLGVIRYTITGAGSHFADLFVDHEVVELANTFFNETGAISGVAAAGQSWEIDEPGFTFGNIYTHFTASALDNTNAVPAGSPDDVSMAMGWDFTLLTGETATIDFFLSEIAPFSGFYLVQSDPDSHTSIYLSSSMGIGGTGGTIPEPASLGLMGLGLLGLWQVHRGKAAK